ncbi:L-xylulose reductase-like [Mercenaria mercenaria]|uniref:L-xylulose reductase-like n=1 Tax=Mercenaria mercenaria TaxID=6596 RepID=UPI00234F046C|nr:L-xylulose reductase-like [Mercenaria mercenaria]
MSFNLAGKKFLVTGAGRGIGRVLSKTLSEQGCKVYALSRTQETLDTLAAGNSNIHTIQADVRNWDELRNKLDGIEVLDGLVNNAGVTDELSGPSLDVSKAFLDRNFETGFLASINTIQVIGNKMVDAKRPGSIVNVSSVFSLQSFPQNLGYTVNKAALDMITKQFALELGPHQIRVNSVNPTLVLTEQVQNFITNVSPVDKIIIEKIPMARIPEVSEIVYPIIYLLSDFSSMVSGTTNIIDGGLMSSFTTKL